MTSDTKPENKGFESEKGYIWSMLGTAIGFANLLGFSSQCYRNGGGAFLIPFFLSLFVLGIPMLFLEGILGQKSHAPLVAVYRRLGPRGSGFFGWISLFTVATIGAFYTVLTSYSVAYCFFSLFNLIPEDTATFFTQSFLRSTQSIEEFSFFSPSLLAANLFVVLFTWVVLSQNIKEGIEKWCSAFLPCLSVMILLFGVTVCFLPGSMQGLYHYLKPDFHKLKDLALWRDVFGQLFFSLSLGIGIVVGYSRHTQKSTDMRRAMTKVALADFFISFMSGFVIFGSIAYLAELHQKPFESIVANASTFQIGYIIFPTILKTFPSYLSPFIGALFFFSVFIAGITGLFSIVESVSGNLEVEFGLKRKTAVGLSLGLIGLGSFVFCMGNGNYLIEALEPMVLGNVMLLGGIAQILAFMYYSPSIANDSIWQGKKGKNLYYYFLKYLSLVILVLSLIFSLQADWLERHSLYFTIRWLWFALVSIFSLVLMSISALKKRS